MPLSVRSVLFKRRLQGFSRRANNVLAATILLVLLRGWHRGTVFSWFVVPGVANMGIEEIERAAAPLTSSPPCDIISLDKPDSELARYLCHFYCFENKLNKLVWIEKGIFIATRLALRPLLWSALRSRTCSSYFYPSRREIWKPPMILNQFIFFGKLTR